MSNKDAMDSWPDHPNRIGLRNFRWTIEAISDWEEIWNALWQLGYKWEWQNADRYARPFGATYKLFGCHNDAVKLDMAVPLPGVEVVEDLRDILLDDIREDSRIGHTIGAVGRWLTKHQGHCRPDEPGAVQRWKKIEKASTSAQEGTT
jgi:hypothetical protein